MQRLAEMSNPLTQFVDVTSLSEIPCRVEKELPGAEVIPFHTNQLKSVKPSRRSCRGVAGNTEGKITLYEFSP